jgi:hypothetical protein
MIIQRLRKYWWNKRTTKKQFHEEVEKDERESDSLDSYKWLCSAEILKADVKILLDESFIIK